MNYLYAGIAAILILLGAEQWGEHRVQVKWDQDAAVRQALLDKTTLDNKEALDANKAQYEKDRLAATSQAGRDAVNRFLRDHGLLPDGSRVSSGGNVPAQSPQGTDGPPSQCGTSGALESFANDCAQDALKVMRWQEICRANHCEID
jgi:hypothetical protein